jgi:hypothetical protein
MKKSIFSLFRLFAASCLYSQSFYFGLGGGYNFMAARQTFQPDSKTQNGGQASIYS